MAISAGLDKEHQMPSMQRLSDAVTADLQRLHTPNPDISEDDLANIKELVELASRAGHEETLKKFQSVFVDVFHRLRIPGIGTPLVKNFEQWLSYLADTPPWLSLADQARNRAAFLDVSEVISRTLSSQQRQTVMQQGCPDWLRKLVRHWQLDSAQVITFNYDQLVELAWLVYGEPSPPRVHSWDLYAAPLTPLTARAGISPTVFSVPGGFRLFKLHGSIGWWYSGPDGPLSDPIYDQGVSGDGWTIEGLSPIGQPFGSLTDGKEPMIVPPAAVKSPYYRNDILRELWKSAAAQLRHAQEVIIMGFSLPATDMLVSSMLCTNVSRGCKLTPVNPDRGVITRICSTFDINENDPRLNTNYVGMDDAIERWVADQASL